MKNNTKTLFFIVFVMFLNVLMPVNTRHRRGPLVEPAPLTSFQCRQRAWITYNVTFIQKSYLTKTFKIAKFEEKIGVVFGPPEFRRGVFFPPMILHVFCQLISHQYCPQILTTSVSTTYGWSKCLLHHLPYCKVPLVWFLFPKNPRHLLKVKWYSFTINVLLSLYLEFRYWTNL